MEEQLVEDDHLHLPTYEMVDVGVVALAVVEVLIVQPQQETGVQEIVDGIVDSMGTAAGAVMVPRRLLGWIPDIG